VLLLMTCLSHLLPVSHIITSAHATLTL